MEENMESLILKKVIFYPEKIVLLKKKGNVEISIDEIKHIYYEKPSFLQTLIGLGLAVGNGNVMEIVLNKEKKGKQKYFLIVKYKYVLDLKKFFRKEIFIINE